ncbi:hypothetical protein BH11BAC6_BH11BAC6_04830 [soil metagenome]
MNPFYPLGMQVVFFVKKISANLRFHKLHILLFSLCIIGTATKSQSTARYNVLLISVDDMNNKVGYLGFPAVLTPNLQRLLNRGVGFTNAYCQFSICNPSRVSMMSGWRPDKTKVVSNDGDPKLKVPANVQYLQDYFHSYGYRTERYGKIYHEQFEYEFTWDYFENYKDSGGSDLTVSTLDETGSGAHENLWGINSPDNFTNPDSIMAAHLVSSLRTPSSTPRFFGFGLISPHAPFVPPIAYWNKYGDSTEQVNLNYTGSQKTVLGNSAHDIVLPNTPADDRTDVPDIAFYRNTTIPLEDSEWQKTIQAYYAEVTLMDANLGTVLDEFDRQNLWDNTVVIFVSDHGQHLGEHQGLWYKNTLFNEAQQVPMIICAPGKSPAISNKLVEEVDIYPTLTELCRLPTPTGMQGSSLVRLLDDPAQPWKRAAFTQTRNNGSLYPLIVKPQAVFTDQYHYNYWGIYGEELYDKVNDSFEYTNLVNDPAYASALDSMRNIRIGDWTSVLPPPCDSVIYYLDNDVDGFGNADSIFKGCYKPFRYVINPGDCNDNDPLINPDAIEICDGIDNNCDGRTDENGIIATITPAGNITWCTGQSLLLSANTGTGISYQWFKNNIAIAGAIGATLTVTKAGNYTVKESNPQGCTGTSAPANVSFVSKPAATITALGNLNICSTGSVVLQANSGTGYSYQWKKGSTIISNATGVQYTATTAATYFVIVTNSTNCSKQSSGKKVTQSCFSFAGKVSTDALLNNFPLTLNLFPNPSNGKVTVGFYSDHTGTIQLKVFDLTGKQLFIKTEPAVKGINTCLIDLPNVATGIYYLELTGNRSPERIKFTISR